jgi:hypothetical protein
MTTHRTFVRVVQPGGTPLKLGGISQIDWNDHHIKNSGNSHIAAMYRDALVAFKGAR